MKKGMIYLDYAASTPMHKSVIELLRSSMSEDFANPSSAHKLGKEILKKVNRSREHFLTVLHANDHFDFIFTSSATESNNTVIKGMEYSEGDEVLFDLTDHPSVTEPIQRLQEQGVKVISFQHGNENSLLNLLTDKTKLVVLSHVNNQSGEILDVESIAEKIKQKNKKTFIHVDGVQAFGKIPYKLTSSIDSYAISSHKIGGPKGVAGLYVKKGAKLNALLDGGKQEGSLRSSTLAAPLITTFEAASKRIFSHLEQNLEKGKEFKAELESHLSHIDLVFKNTSPFIFTFLVPGISSDILLRHMEMEDIFISSSSACSSKIKGENPAFTALGIDKKFHKNLLRVSWGEATTKEEIEKFIKTFNQTMDNLRHLVKRY